MHQRRASAAPTKGSARIGKCAVEPCGRRSGSAGETSVSVLIRSGRPAAARTATAPPIELPTRWTGPRPSASMSLITVAASDLIE